MIITINKTVAASLGTNGNEEEMISGFMSIQENTAYLSLLFQIQKVLNPKLKLGFQYSLLSAFSSLFFFFLTFVNAHNGKYFPVNTYF